MAHIPAVELAKRISDAGKLVEVGGTYSHYKDPTKQYKVLSIAIQEWDDEPCVIYESLYDTPITFVRPLSNWTESVDGVPRFKKV